MGFKSFKASGQEQDVILTTPNGISAARGGGGIVLGGLLATKGIEPESALAAASVLAVSDAEGALIQMTANMPRLQRLLRTVPSKIGRKLDPVMDKLFAASVFFGASIGGQIPLGQAIPILATETATAASTLYVASKGGDPEVSNAGTWGMIARMGSIVLNLAAYSVEPSDLHNTLSTGGIVSTVVAVGLGALSCTEIIRQRPQDTNSSAMSQSSS